MTTLTDRYVWAVLRAVPQRQARRAGAGDPGPRRGCRRGPRRPRVGRGRRARRARGARRPGRARRAVHGHDAVPHRPAPVPGVGAAAAAAPARSSCRSPGSPSGRSGGSSGKPVGEAIVGGLGVAFTVAVQLVFWFTLVFAIAERTGHRPSCAVHGQPWSPDQLPELPAPDRMSLGEAVASIAFAVFVVVAIVWEQVAAADRDRGHRLPAVRSDDLVLVAVVRPGAGRRRSCSRIALYLRGRWTWALRDRQRGPRRRVRDPRRLPRRRRTCCSTTSWSPRSTPRRRRRLVRARRWRSRWS